ncbi:MAG: Gfo/Idh/MocA family oxidoreductase [Planctomycetota bacterium]|nr:Gfo/Idh/MocA family oxidoreductase [Planctomycetota bacterium]
MQTIRSTKDIHAGIVGFGMGQHHAGELTKAGITLTAVCDRIPARRESAQTLYPGIQTYASPAEMLKRADVNLCVVATPHNTHCAVACQCLRAGKHVVVEKPMAITAAECDKMIATAKRNRVTLTVYHNRHWDGFAKQMVQMVKKEKAIGTIVRIDAHGGSWYGGPGPEKIDIHAPGRWRASKSISGGILYDMGAHLTEYVFQLIDSPVVEVSGMGHVGFWNAASPWGNDSNEDEMNAVVRFRSGQWLLMSFSTIDSCPKDDRGWMEITGTEGTYIMQPGSWRLIRFAGGRKTVTSGGDLSDSWTDFYRNLVAHLVKGKRLAISPELGRRVVKVLDLAGRSFKKGRTIQAKF